jgi:hypothetical protein
VAREQAVGEIGGVWFQGGISTIRMPETIEGKAGDQPRIGDNHSPASIASGGEP